MFSVACGKYRESGCTNSEVIKSNDDDDDDEDMSNYICIALISTLDSVVYIFRNAYHLKCC